MLGSVGNDVNLMLIDHETNIFYIKGNINMTSNV